MRFSANLGFLWADRSLPEAIRAAHVAGFDAVECHWPYDFATDDIKAALTETGLPMLGLNTRRGDVPAGDNGLCAIPGREVEAQAAISEAIAYADAIGAGAVHVMAGYASGQDAYDMFCSNLKIASSLAHDKGIDILIEPLNKFDAPGYFLKDTDLAACIIEDLARPNLKLMFDCYHVGRTEGDVIARLKQLLPIIGHIQFASVPDRAAPDCGDLDYSDVFVAIRELGWEKPLGAEYKPQVATDDSLSWMTQFSG